MKQLIILFINLLVFTQLRAQNTSFSQASIIQSYPLEITLHKTTLLIFPSAVQSADRGAEYILAEKVKGAENVLKVKAAAKDFEPSNLQVITADGNVYTFNLSYADQPPAFTVDLGSKGTETKVSFEGVSLNNRELTINAQIVAALEPFFKQGRYSKYGTEFYLQGIHIKNDVLFLSYHLKNYTGIRLDEGSLRFFVRDKKKPKRTAIQDREVIPLLLSHKGKPEDASGQTIVAAFAKFSIAEDKYFAAEFMEQGGDRNPSSRLDQKVLFKSRVIR